MTQKNKNGYSENSKIHDDLKKEDEINKITSHESEKKYRFLFDAAPVGIGIADMEGNIYDANKAMQEMMGYTLPELKNIGVPNTYAVPEERRLLVKTIKEKKKVRDMKISLKRRDGSVYSALLNVDMVEIDGKDVLLTTARDVTEKAALEKKRQESEEQYRSLFENSPVSLWEEDSSDVKKYIDDLKSKGIDLKTYFKDHPEEVRRCAGMVKVANVNKATLALFKTKNKKDLTRGLPDIFTDYSYDKYMEELLAISENKTTYECEDFLRTFSGDIINVLLKWSLAPGHEETYSKRIVSLINITEHKRKEELLRLFSYALDEAPDGVQIVDLEGYITYSNPAVEKIYGFTPEEFRGKHVNEMNVDTEFAGRIILPSILNTGNWAGELMVKHKNGSVFPIWLATSLVRNNKGEPIAMVGIIRDMTERKRIEEALREGEERYRSLFESSPVSLWEEDSSEIKRFIDNLRRKGIKDFRDYFENHPQDVSSCVNMVKVVDVNKATLEMFKAEDKFELMERLGQVFTDRSYNVFREELIAIAEGRTTFESEDIAKTLLGNLIHINLKWCVASGHEKTYSKVLVSVIDITHRKRTEEEIKKYSRELEESNRMKELFIDIMHHDLLNPLSIAKGYIGLYQEAGNDFQKMEYLDTVEKNLLKGIELIDNATIFSRLENLECLEYEKINLKKITDQVIENLNPLIARAGMKIENTVSHQISITANKIIENVLANLISNAVKYAPEGKKIIVDCRERNGFWRIRVKDFGEGIPDAQKNLIFDRFQRMEKKGVKGSGLGLAISRKIMELHKGRIWVEDNPEGGSVFIVDIPKRLE